MKLTEEHIEQFLSEIRARLLVGEREYGSSLSRKPEELTGEILEELADVAGWACLVWTKLRERQAKMADG